MRYPMILPWLARKAGVSVPVAERLWDEVIRENGTRVPGGLRASSYWGGVLREWRKRLAREGVHSPSPQTTAWVIDAPSMNVFFAQALAVQQVWAAWAGSVRRLWAAWLRFLPWHRAI